jgi:drug/metabolite transporter (DMT)-like permease
MIGVLVVIGRGSWATLVQVQFVVGDLLMLLAIIGWAFYSWLLARPPASMRGDQRPAWDWAGFLLVQTLFGLLAASAFSAAEQALGAPDVRWSPGVAAALLYISVGASIVAYRCWGLGVAAGGPALAAFFNNLTPLFAAVLSALVLGDHPRPYHALAFLFIVGGIFVSTPGAGRFFR